MTGAIAAGAKQVEQARLVDATCDLATAMVADWADGQGQRVQTRQIDGHTITAEVQPKTEAFSAAGSRISVEVTASWGEAIHSYRWVSWVFSPDVGDLSSAKR
ncbi:MAG: hypothetical protein IMW91_03555 [Firmicutes bacterium]|nr:hypothetical protein [Bacillota bacterium]